MNTTLPEGADERFRNYYELISLCNATWCPDFVWQFKCTVETCPIESSNWDYLPSLVANAIFIALFSLSLACYLGQGLMSRSFKAFTIVMVAGCILEVLGYAGRIMAYHNPWSQVR